MSPEDSRLSLHSNAGLAVAQVRVADRVDRGDPWMLSTFD